jgi:hypothetical protein
VLCLASERPCIQLIVEGRKEVKEGEKERGENPKQGYNT